MRFRLVERKAGAPRRLPTASAPEKTPPAPPRAADLDNPYVFPHHQEFVL